MAKKVFNCPSLPAVDIECHTSTPIPIGYCFPKIYVCGYNYCLFISTVMNITEMYILVHLP